MIEKLDELPPLKDGSYACDGNWGYTDIADYDAFARSIYDIVSQLIEKNNELIDEVNRLKAIVGE